MSKVLLEIPRECFIYRDADEELASEQKEATPVVKMTWDKGIFLYLQGAEFPQKGMTNSQTMWAVNIGKRNLMEMLKLIKSFPVSFAFQFITNPRRLIERIVQTYIDMSWRLVRPFVLKNEYMTSVGQEIQWACYTFLDNIGVHPKLASDFAEIFSSLIEYDNAYRLRLEDIFSETNKTLLMKNPRGEIKRLLKLIVERDDKVISKKFKLVLFALQLALLHPIIKKAFMVTISKIDIRKMGLDEIDRYWCCLRKDYKFFGKSYEERKEMLKGKSIPVLLKI